MIIRSIFYFTLCVSSYSFACEPASLNWEKFHHTYDLNKNETFELKEFLTGLF